MISNGYAKNKSTPKNDSPNDNKELCCHYIKRQLEESNHALTYLDFDKYDKGTLRNVMSKLVKEKQVLKLPNEAIARFILPQWAIRPEYRCIAKNDTESMVGKLDFLSVLTSLPWSKILAVHNLKLCFEVYQLGWLDKQWSFNSCNKSFSRTFPLSYPTTVHCYDTGTVMVSIKSSCKPFKLTVSGLLSLSNLLGELKNALHSPSIPEPSNWVIVQWHLNRDTETIEGSGYDFNVTFRDFFDATARIYYKHELNRVRAEIDQSPKKTLPELFEDIISRN